MPTKEQVPAAIEAVRDLQNDVHSPEDQLVLNAWKKEVGNDRAKTLAEIGERHNQPTSYTEVAGTVVPTAAVEKAREQGHDMSSAYNAGAHSNS